MISISIEMKALSNNKIKDMNRFVYQRKKRAIELMIWRELIINDIDIPIEREKKKKRIEICAHLSPRRYDEDNLEGGMKPVIDCLRALRLIYNDSPRWLEKKISQKLAKRNMIEISIDEVHDV
jgi:hypothetical protein